MLTRTLEADELGLKDLVKVGNDWERTTELMTFDDEAIKAQAIAEQHKAYEAMPVFQKSARKGHDAQLEAA